MKFNIKTIRLIFVFSILTNYIISAITGKTWFVYSGLMQILPLIIFHFIDFYCNMKDKINKKECQGKAWEWFSYFLKYITGKTDGSSIFQ